MEIAALNKEESKYQVIKKYTVEYYSSICAFLFFALSLVVPTGYSYGPALLLLVALPNLFFKSTYQNICFESKLLITAFIVFSGVWFVEIAVHQYGSRDLDSPIRFVAAIFVFLFLLKQPPKQAFIWAGIAIGAIATGVFAIWTKHTTGVERVTGYTNAIQYGNLSMLLGFLSISGIVWAKSQFNYKLGWLFLLILGFVGGLTASLLSGSRGGWVGAPLIVIYLLYQYKEYFSKKIILITMAFLVLTVTIIISIPSTNIKSRITSISEDLMHYNYGNVNTSVGIRLELWRGSILMFLEKPFLGWGEKQFENKIDEYIDQGLIKSELATKGHSHNELLYAAAKMGLLGLLALLILYALPIYIFKRIISKNASSKENSIAIAGVIVVISYIDFGLTQAFFSHNSGVMFYPFVLIVFASSITKKTIASHDYDKS